jgi:hypothetical protein
MGYSMFWDILAYTSVLIASLMLAIDIGIRRSREPAEMPPLFLSNFWGFAPLILMTLAGVVWIVRAADYKLFRSLSDLAQQTTPSQAPPTPLHMARSFPTASPTSTPTPTPPTASPSPMATQTLAPTPSASNVPAIDPQILSLTGILHGRNYRKAEAQARANLGRRITLSGVVQDVYRDTVIFRKPTSEDPTTFMFFDPSSIDTLRSLKEGDQITVQGEIERIEANVLELRHCQIFVPLNNRPIT